jgi:hypothetical protein
VIPSSARSRISSAPTHQTHTGMLREAAVPECLAKVAATLRHLGIDMSLGRCFRPAVLALALPVYQIGRPMSVVRRGRPERCASRGDEKRERPAKPPARSLTLEERSRSRPPRLELRPAGARARS